MIGRTVCGALIVYCIASASEHRSRAVTREFQREHPCPRPGTQAVLAQLSEKITLCRWTRRGSNLQWQAMAAAGVTDAWEREACAR
jgi:hypothetical protein